MPYLVGTDEAGYGPNLGPLAITATVWHIPDDDMGIDLYRRLGTVARPSDPANRASSKLLFGDSKKLYTPGGGLAKLERGVLAAIYALPRHLPTTWRGLFQFCDVESVPQLDELIWYRDFDRPLPVAISRQQADDETRQLQPALEGAGVRLIDIQSRVVFPSRYNEYVERCDSKGLALSEWTLQLVRQVIEPLGPETVFVQCDKHGGRNRYAAVLQHIFPEHFLEVLQESRQESVYRWGQAANRVEIRFTAKGERFLPTALASMVSKYLRELAMVAFNEFWCQRVAGLKPTAGYPVDAKQFFREIRDQKQQLGIADASIWRQR